jgi:hypothetical protein
MRMPRQTTGELHLAIQKWRHQWAGTAVLAAVPTQSTRMSSRTTLEVARGDRIGCRVVRNRGSYGECRFRLARCAHFILPELIDTF